MSVSELKFSRLTPLIGAEISGVDLSKPVGQDMLDAIYDALMEHHVIFFRDQQLSPQSHLDFARSFGEPEPPHPVYPNVDGFENIVKLENDGDNPPDTDGWHTDLTFRQNPPFSSILWARTVPETGGDTIWCNLCAAYEALPEGLKSELAEMTAVHDMGDFRNNFTVGQTSGERLMAAHQRFGSAIHPIVQVHPVTGRKFLYVNDGFTVHVVGLRARESSRLLTMLFEHMNQPEFQVRFRWQNNSLAMWDNRCTMHYAVADYMPHYRCMHRITVVDDRRAVAGGRQGQAA
jgi:taurine dioxygenase